MFPTHHYPPQEHHIHYHYHYHYDPPSSPKANTRPPSQISAPKTARVLSPRTYASSIETNYWKQHVNPEVSRLYSTIHPRQSRFSQNCNRISEEDSVVEETTPLGSKKQKLLETQCEENTTFGEQRPLSKLETLYYSKQAGKGVQDVESISSQPDDAYFSIHEEKLRGYRREMQRMKRIEEQCEYLREHFMLHIQAKHKQEHS